MKKLKNIKHIFIIIILSLIFLFGGILLFSKDFKNSINGFFIYRTWNDSWQDTIYAHTLKPSKDIIIIKIDEKTLNNFQSGSDLKMLTIPKSKYTQLVDLLHFAKAKWVGFDIIFQNKDETEEEFARKMSEYKNIAIASFEYNGEPCIQDTEGEQKTCNGAPRSVYKNVPWGLININNSYIRTLLVDISKTPYKDWKWSDDILYTLPLEMAILGQKSHTGISTLTNSRSRPILNPYFWWPNSYTWYSFVDVLNMPKYEAIDIFEWKYVLIGESGTALHDSVISPVSSTKMDGVELHAHFLDGIIQNKMLENASDSSIWIVSILLTIITILFYFYLPNIFSPIFATMAILWVIWISRYLYDVHRTLVDISPLLLSVCVATFPMTYIYRFFVVDNEKRYIENAFGHYIDPKMVQMINMEEVSLTLGGEQKELSVFFSDIAGFTTISEKLSPQDLFCLMSLSLSPMTEILKKEWGTLDKYIGDAVMGFFWAPVTQSDHAIRACRTAVEMRRILPELNREITAKWIQAVSFRVGIASGDVMVWNIGSTDHFNYTVLGDTVNLASRLEATGKEYDMHVIISEWTRNQIGDLFALRELDTIAVKWKTEGIRIFELLGFKWDITDRSMYDTYEKWLKLYREGKYMEAGKIWESQMDTDPVSRVMALRCVEIIKWNIIVENGVYHMTHK